jgi:hypothetical protein
MRENISAKRKGGRFRHNSRLADIADTDDAGRVET